MSLYSILRNLALLVPFTVLVPVGARGETVDACALITNDEFSQVVGERFYSEPIATPGSVFSACDYDGWGTVLLYPGPDSQSQWEKGLASLQLAKPDRVNVDGIGDSAYAVYTQPESESRPTYAVVVVAVGERTIVVTLDTDDQPGESGHDKAVALARIAAEGVK